MEMKIGEYRMIMTLMMICGEEYKKKQQMDGLRHQNQNGQHLEQHLTLQVAPIKTLALAPAIGLLRSTIRTRLITRNSTMATSALKRRIFTIGFAQPRLSKNNYISSQKLPQTARAIARGIKQLCLFFRLSIVKKIYL